MSEWYYRIAGTRRGPVRSSQLRQLARAGEITPDTPVWREGLDSWIPASRLKGLFAPGTGASEPEAASTSCASDGSALGVGDDCLAAKAGLPPPSTVGNGEAIRSPLLGGERRLRLWGERRPASDYGVLRYVGATIASLGWGLIWIAHLLSVCFLFPLLPKSMLVYVLAIILPSVMRGMLPKLARNSSLWFAVVLWALPVVGFISLFVRLVPRAGGLASGFDFYALPPLVGVCLVPVILAMAGIFVIGFGEFLQAGADVASNSWAPSAPREGIRNEPMPSR